MRSCSIFKPHLIAEALRRRAPLAARPDLTAYRLLQGDAEGVPGLAVDRYDRVAVVHADERAVFERWRPTLEAELDGIDAAYLKMHPRQASRLSADERRRRAPVEPVWGPPIEQIEVLEGGVRYLVQPGAGLSVGLFLDMRDVRAWLRRSVEGKRVLNLFAYTCSLGVCAALGGARRVLNVDLSRAVLDWGKTNYALNDLRVDDHDFVYGDALDWLARLSRRAAEFDVVIVDPPSFSSTPFSVTRDYPRLVALAARVVGPTGMLLAATNHAGTSERRFEDWLHAGLTMADRHGQLVQRWREPHPDFPMAVGRGPSLKVRALVLD